MTQFRLQTILVALAVLSASSYCAMECAVQPCHNTQAASQENQPPPCHQHEQQPNEGDAPPSCLHSQLVTDYQVTASALPDLMSAQDAVGLPQESIFFGALDVVLLATPQETSPPLSPQFPRSTVLRI